MAHPRGQWAEMWRCRWGLKQKGKLHSVSQILFCFVFLNLYFIDLLPIFRTCRTWCIHPASYIFVSLWEMLTSRIKEKLWCDHFWINFVWWHDFFWSAFVTRHYIVKTFLVISDYVEVLTFDCSNFKPPWQRSYFFFCLQQNSLITKVPSQNLLARFDREL